MFVKLTMMLEPVVAGGEFGGTLSSARLVSAEAKFSMRLMVYGAAAGGVHVWIVTGPCAIALGSLEAP
jgi:hypothetical protein